MAHDAPERVSDLERGGKPAAAPTRAIAAPAAELHATDALAGHAAQAPVDAPAPRLRPDAIQRLQGRAGNAAVSAMLQRRAGAPSGLRRPAPVQRKPSAVAPSVPALGGAAAKASPDGGGSVTEVAGPDAATDRDATSTSPARGPSLASPPPAPPNGGTAIQRRGIGDAVAEAQKRVNAPAGAEDTASVEGDVDRSDFTAEPALAAAERATNPAPPPPPPPPTPPGVVEAKNVPKPPPKPPAKKVGKALVAGPKAKKKVAGASKAAPPPGEIVKRPAPPLPPPYRKPKEGPGELPPPPAPPKAVKAAQDPGFAKVVTAAKMTVAKARRHPKGHDEAAAAQAAAVAPANDIDAQAKANRADSMATAKPKPFDENAFVAAVEAEMRKAAPKNLDEAGDVDQKAGAVKGAIGDKVAKGKDAAGGDVEDKAAQPPDPSTATPKPVTPLTPLEIEQPGGTGASGGMPAPVGNEQVDFRHGPAKVDNEMADAGVTEEQLAKSNEPEFTGALDAKKEGEEHSAQAPADVRNAEAGILKQAALASASEEKKVVGDAKGTIGTTIGQIAGQKDATKSKDELKRKEVADHINSIFDKTKLDVGEILDGIDTKVDELFTKGEADIRSNFTKDWNQRLAAYKEDRYSGLRGKYRWVRDKFKGLPAAANRLFEQSRAVYERDMQKLIRGIAQTVTSELNRATVRIEHGRGEVSAYVGSLKGDLAKFGQEAAADMGDKFDNLDSSVKDKFDDLAGSLAKKYAESQAAVNEEIAAAQEANKGLIDKAIDAVKGVIRVITQLKDMILNVLSRIASVMGTIIADPIKFLKNFVSAVKAGITRFMDRIGEHLQKGLMGWLTGSLGATGIEIPDSFSVQGIMKLVLSVLGMTWTFVRERIAKKIGEPAMAALESGADIIKKVMTGGPSVLWDMLLEKFSDFENMVIGEIKSFVMEKVVKSGITFLISLLNPAAAFIKACKMIYDVVMFFVERGSQIKEFIDTLIDAAGDIARGGTGGIAEKIEGTLARLLPLAISFLASILGLGGVGEKVRSIIDKVRNPLHKAMDKVVDVVVKVTAPVWKPAKKLFEKGKKLYGKAKDKVLATYEKGKAKVKATYAAGKAKVKDLYGKGKKKVTDTAKVAKDKVVSLFKKQEKGLTMGGERHNLKATPDKKGRFVLSMASVEMLLSKKIGIAINSLEAQEKEAKDSAEQRQVQAQIKQLREIMAIAARLERAAVGSGTAAVLPNGAPPGFAEAMDDLAKQIEAYGKKNGVKDIAVATADAVVVDLRLLSKFGLPMPNYLQAQKVADGTGTPFDIRATNLTASKLYEKGANPKSAEFKQKTINDTDLLLGAPVAHLGKVAWFLPARPHKGATEKLMQEEGGRKIVERWWGRWRQRKAEYYEYEPKLKKKLKEGEILIYEAVGSNGGGVIRDAVNGLPFTGDHDLYAIHGNPGPVIRALEKPPFSVQHGAHVDWPRLPEVLKKGGLDAAEAQIYNTIIKAHAPGGEALLRINPNGPPTAVSSSTPALLRGDQPVTGGGGGGGSIDGAVVKAEPEPQGFAGLVAAEKRIAAEVKEREAAAAAAPPPARGKKAKVDPTALPAEKQKRLDDAVSAIRPKVLGLLEKGVTGKQLRQKLDGWRDQHGLTKLEVQSSGKSFDIIATVNPSASIVRAAVQLVGPEVNRILREVGEAVLAESAIQGEMKKIAAARQAAREAKAPLVRAAQSPAAEAAALRDSGAARKAGERETIRMGGERVEERQTYTSKPGHVHTGMTVEIEGKLQSAARYNPEVTGALAEMSRAGISAGAIRDGMFNLLQGRDAGPAFAAHPAARSQLAAITRLLFVVEPARNPSAMATSMMGVAAAGAGQGTMDQAVTNQNPMHLKDAGKKSRSGDAVADVARGKSRRIGESRRLEGTQWQAIERETAINYLEALLKSKELRFTSQWEVEKFVRDEFRGHLLKRLRALMTTVGGE